VKHFSASKFRLYLRSHYGEDKLKMASSRRLNTHQMISVYTTPGKFENAAISCHFGFVFIFMKTRAGNSYDFCDTILSEKLCSHDIFRPPQNARRAFPNFTGGVLTGR